MHPASGHHIGRMLREQSEALGDQPYLVMDDRKYTLAEMEEVSNVILGGIRELGVVAGDRIAILSSNRMEYAELFYACAKGGVIDVPLNMFLRGQFLRFHLEDSAPKVIVVDAAGAEAIAPLVAGLDDLQAVVLLDDADVELAGVMVVPYAQLLTATPVRDIEELGPDGVLSIMYTSGTTGMPKGCMMTHGWYSHGPRAASDMLQYQSGDVFYTPLPLFHGLARGLMTSGMAFGLEAVIDSEFSAHGLMPRLMETNATLLEGVGVIGSMMLASEPSELDRQHSLRGAFLFPFPEDQQHQFRERFGCDVFTQMYGQTECAAITYSRIGETGKPASTGRPAPYYEVTLVDGHDVEVPVGEVGEIVVRPREKFTMFGGYWNRGEATVETWRNLWHHTGDLARMDEDGYVYFVDRKSDSLRRRGENISSIQLEKSLVEHPAIAEAAVHAVPSELVEDEIKACLVLAGGEDITPEAFFEFCRRELPYFAIPRYVEIMDELPKTATFRVRKHILRDRGITPDTWDLEALGLRVARQERRASTS